MTDTVHGLVCPWCGGRNFQALPPGRTVWTWEREAVRHPGMHHDWITPGEPTFGGAGICRDCLEAGRRVRVSVDLDLLPEDTEIIAAALLAELPQ